MFALSRRFFSAEAVKEVEKAAAEAAKQLQKDYTTQCSTVMKVRGHHKIALNTVKSKNGQEMRFDFSYGWPFRYYCKCNPSTEPVTKEMIQSFEKELKDVGVNPAYGVYFSKGAFEGQAADMNCLVVDAKALAKMESEKNGRRVRQNKVIFFCCLAMTYLAWTFFSEKNPQRRRLVERWHRYVLKDGINPYAPKEEPQPEQDQSESVVESEPVVEPVIEMAEAPIETEVETEVEMPVEQMIVLEEENTEAEADSSDEGFFSYLNKTFWWLLGYK